MSPLRSLFGLGVTPEVAQTILRHSDASTTRKHSILLKSLDEGRDAMRRLEQPVGQGMGKGSQPEKSQNFPQTLNQSRRSSVGRAADS